MWLRVNHAGGTALWVRISKKATGHPEVTCDDGVVTAIAWGWIDGLRNAPDDTSPPQRFTRGRARQQDSAAYVSYATLKRQSQFTPYHRLHSAERLGARQKCPGVSRAAPRRQSVALQCSPDHQILSTVFQIGRHGLIAPLLLGAVKRFVCGAQELGTVLAGLRHHGGNTAAQSNDALV